MRKEIKELLDSEVTAYSIAKETKIPVSTMTVLKSSVENRDEKLDNLSFKNAEKLYNYYEGVFKMTNELKELKELASKLRTADHQPQISIYTNRAELLDLWKQNGDEDVDWDAHANEVLADFDSKEYVIKVLWDNGVPEYFHESETNEIMDRI
jgi:hypothetical protein